MESELVQIEETESIIGSRVDTPLSFCFETLDEIGNESYAENPALKVGNVAFVKDAP